MAAIPKPTGRPSEYRPAYCETVVSAMGEGMSLGAVAGKIGCARSTIYVWAEAHPEFMDAVKRGQAKAQLFWERRLLAVAENGAPPGTVTAIIFALKCRARDDWQDASRVEDNGRSLQDELESDRPILQPDEPVPVNPIL